METKNFNLPQDHKPFEDKYFLRTKEILQKEGINPFVRAQVMIRKGPGKVYGLEESLAIIDKYSNLRENGGRIYSLKEGSSYNPSDTLMLIESRIQDIVDLETMYLGVIAAETTKRNDNHGIDLADVTKRMRAVVDAAEGRPVMYFGPRHWRYDEDAAITRAAYEGGATSASSDIGADTFGQKGVGTIPHVLENIMAWKYGKENAVTKATEAFDKHIDSSIPRIALIDYRNHEIDDSLTTAKLLGDRLYAVRMDTCGENLAQGAKEGNRKYWEGNGVTITGAYALRKALDDNGYKNVKMVLSSGFAKHEKVAAFVEAEKELGVKLFDSLGVGQVFDSRASKMDIVAVGETRDSMISISKTGRFYRPNKNLELVLGGEV